MRLIYLNRIKNFDDTGVAQGSEFPQCVSSEW